MKVNRLILIFMSLISVASMPSRAANTTESLVIRNVTLVNADATLSKPRNVFISGGRIQSIGTQSYKADKIIEARGQFLIPGLIDTHVHLRGVPGVPEGILEKEDFYQQALAQIPRSYLYAGFTTLLDLANAKGFIDGWNNQPLAPKAYFCTPVLVPKGYPIAAMPEDVQIKMDVTRYFLNDRHSHPHAKFADPTAHTPAHLVDAMKKEGALCAKVFYETGFGAQKNLPVPSEAIVRELVIAAHKKQLPVFLHGNSQASYEFALASGVDMLVHGLWNALPTTTSVELNQITQRLIKAKIAVQPTVQVIYGEQELLNPDFFHQASIHQYMPTTLINWYQTDAGQWMKQEIGSYFDREKESLSDVQKYQQIKSLYQPMLVRVQQISQPLNKKSLLVFGSDTPSGPIYTQFPGLNGRLEMDRWQAMGIPLSDLFKALTIGNATRMGLEKEIGSVTKDKQADLLLLGKNPLEDITAYDAIHWVILDGQPIARESLSAQKIKFQQK